MKSGEDEAMSDIKSRLKPVLLIVRISSADDPTQTSPKLPLSAIAVTTSGAGESAASNRNPSMLPQPVQASHPGPEIYIGASGGGLPDSLFPNRTSRQISGPCL